MTNYERIKNMTKEEIVEFLEKVVPNIGSLWCNNFCDLREDENFLCTIPDDKSCPYLDDKLVIGKWLEVENKDG